MGDIVFADDEEAGRQVYRDHDRQDRRQQRRIVAHAMERQVIESRGQGEQPCT